eukprot:gene12870-14098_t
MDLYAYDQGLNVIQAESFGRKRKSHRSHSPSIDTTLEQRTQHLYHPIDNTEDGGLSKYGSLKRRVGGGSHKRKSETSKTQKLEKFPDSVSEKCPSFTLRLHLIIIHYQVDIVVRVSMHEK